jgi:hypothetical protein
MQPGGTWARNFGTQQNGHATGYRAGAQATGSLRISARELSGAPPDYKF